MWTVSGTAVLIASAWSQAQPDKPIIVRIPADPPKSELSGLADVLLGSLGLTGVIVLAAVVLGAVMASIMIWVRSRDADRAAGEGNGLPRIDPDADDDRRS